jgi:hypothetical protein
VKKFKNILKLMFFKRSERKGRGGGSGFQTGLYSIIIRSKLIYNLINHYFKSCFQFPNTTKMMWLGMEIDRMEK